MRTSWLFGKCDANTILCSWHVIFPKPNKEQHWVDNSIINSAKKKKKRHQSEIQSVDRPVCPSTVAKLWLDILWWSSGTPHFHPPFSAYQQAQPQEAQLASALSPPGSWASRQAPWPCSWLWVRWHEWQSEQWLLWATAGRKGDRWHPGWQWATDPGGNPSL